MRHAPQILRERPAGRRSAPSPTALRGLERSALCLCALLSGAPAAQAQEREVIGAQDPPAEDFLESRPFSIPDKQDARVLYDTALGHVNAGRFTEAVTVIERLIDEHSGSVIALPLGDELPPRSTQPLYRGAASAARDLLARLSPQAQAAYADRYLAKSRQLLARASAALDTTALADLALHYPLTPAARDAWWTLGDIEAEAGNLDAARAAWKRAGETANPADTAAEPSARAHWNPGDGEIRSAHSASNSNAAMDALEIPSSAAHHWEGPLSMNEGQPGAFSNRGQTDCFNSFPIIAGDIVLASNSLTLTAVDALTGRVRWRSLEHPGWASVRAGNYVARDGKEVFFADFFEGIDFEGLMLAPAAGSGIAIAALQVPFTPRGNTSIQGQIRITTVLPDRRLHAFDLETGRPLWDHAPPALWDCDSGPFTQSMRVAGPPVIAGARVLVPMWRPQGRIAYHVACYELATGAYLWSTQVASGQRPLNMFGRPEREFCAPPLVVHGEKVIALTQLGTVAALDLFSGEILWQTVYEQVALPAADGMQAGHRDAVWRNAPPAVDGGVIVATPVDSFYMLGIDLESGAVHWSLPARSLIRFQGGPWCLLGLRNERVFLGGRFVLTLRAAEGLSGDLAPKLDSCSENLFGDGYADTYGLPRAVLTSRHVIVPTSRRRIALERENLQHEDPRFSAAWGEWNRAGFGNLAVGDGAMYSLSAEQLCGVLDWRSMERRFEEDFARRPDDLALAIRLGEFLRERAASELIDADLSAALEHVQRAERVLGVPADAGLLEARIALFESLRLEAKILRRNVASPLSILRLERAVLLAPDAPRRALVLAQLARTARDIAPQRFESALAELERAEVGLDFPSEPDEKAGEARSVLRWVIEQRIGDAATRGEPAREFAALVDLLDRCGDGPLSPAVFPDREGETPARRIERLLATGARARAAWQPFEDQARAALKLASESADGAALERLTRVFPHTSAAREARDARLRLAIETRDSPTAVRTAFEELPADWSANNSTPRQAQLIWLAALALKSDGNPAFAASLLQRLAQFQPRTPADDRDPSVSFAMLWEAQGSAAQGAAKPAKEADFDVPSREIAGANDETVLLGRLDLAGHSVFILAARDRFDALDADGQRLWTRPVEGAIAPQAWLANALLVPGVASAEEGVASSGRVVISGRRGVQALDAATGEALWNWSVKGRLFDPPLAHDGGVLTVPIVPDGSQAAVLVGIDLGRGTELWRRSCSADNWVQPVVGSGLAVLLPRSAENRSAEVLEIATGTLVRELDVGQFAPSEDRRAAWIENGRLILPRFGRSRVAQDGVVAYDVESGARAWRVPGDAARLLDSIVRCGVETYLVYLVSGSGSGSGGLVELDTRIGAVREIPGVSLGPDDLPIGLRSGAVTRLEAPYLFLRSPAPEGKDTLVRSVHLPYGPRWAWRMPLTQSDLSLQSLPLPAVSSRLIVLAYTVESHPAGGRRQSITRLVMLERDSGTPRASSDLPATLGPSEALELATFGNLLLVSGKARTMILAGNDKEEQR